MRNYWKWLIGGSLAFWAYKAYAQGSKPGNLSVTITFKPGGLNMASMNNALNAILGMRQVCTGAPDIQNAASAPSVAGNTVGVVFSALWTHDRLGPIKETVRACYLAHLQALDKNVIDIRAERVS
jgi:hypothetical protein